MRSFFQMMDRSAARQRSEECSWQSSLNATLIKFRSYLGYCVLPQLGEKGISSLGFSWITASTRIKIRLYLLYKVTYPRKCMSAYLRI